MEKIIDKCVGFQWDKGNSEKNWEAHKVLKSECEQTFFNKPLLITDSKKQPVKEKRWYLLGRTDLDRKLFIVFTVRKNLIRIISARDMSKKERGKYNEEIEKDTEI
jgi:uncharacterized DUF497 family protein